jgi:hypothetical protein
MKEQEFVLRKFVRATSADEAIKKDAETPVSEAYLLEKPELENKKAVRAIGFIAPKDRRER